MALPAAIHHALKDENAEIIGNIGSCAGYDGLWKMSSHALIDDDATFDIEEVRFLKMQWVNQEPMML